MSIKLKVEPSLKIRQAELEGLGVGWLPALTSLGVGLLVLFAGYFPTFLSMVQIWERSETFTHGYLIFPISLWLIWRRRFHLLKTRLYPDWRGILAIAGLGFGWLLASVVDVLVVQQLCFIALIVALVWTVLGEQVVREIAFPLGFLFFAVPIGEFLIPPLMNFTADFTVKMIELTGIPVYREGTFFSLPSGDWSVVEGCSGLRYLIASITLGCLYAYLSYQSMWRRLSFIALATFFPVVANGLRAYLIVMIAHFSDMKLALGVDHYIYGWVFFGFVMLTLFWIGSFWQEKKPEPGWQALSESAIDHILPARIWVLPTLAALAVLTVWPAYATYLRSLAQAELAPSALTLPQEAGGWRKSEADLTPWKPHYLSPDAVAEASYSDGKRQAKLYLLYYRTQAQGKELVNSQNVLIPQKHPVWQMPWEKPRKVTLAGHSLKVREGLLKSSGQTLLVWRWNWVSDTFTVSDPLAKLLDAKDRLLGSPKDAAGIVVAAACEDSCREASDTLHAFTQAMLPHLGPMLESVAMERYR